MEVMEEGNIMDRVHILLQRDMAYYQERQTVLTEKLCPGVAGGPLDFPRHTSFAAYKVVTWWEEAYATAFGKSSGLLADDPTKEPLDSTTPGHTPSARPPPSGNTTTAQQRRADFEQLTSSSTGEFLEHLHALSQEALDHADLGVLSATLGAAALLRSCLWCYQRLLPPAAQSAPSTADSLVTAHHKMHELAEALAERLLDLHCRLLSLYVLQEAQSLNWESSGAFSEGERSSFTIQMWWLYVQGVRQDLWTSIPPATAQRVLAGVLNESLTILVARYWHARPSAARASQLNGDVSNLLQCVYALLPALSADASHMTGSDMSDAALRDVHSKCRRLLTILVLRGAPLRSLHAAFRRGLENTAAVRKPNRNLLRSGSEKGSPEAWLRLAGGGGVGRSLSDADAVSLEMAVLLAQPQPNWPLLVRVLMMRNYLLSKSILKLLMVDEAEHTSREEHTGAPYKGCGLFLCAGDCDCGLDFGNSGVAWRGALEEALVLVLAAAGGGAALASALQPVLSVSSETWGAAMDKSHLWSPRRPPWLSALLLPLAPVVRPAVDCLHAAASSGMPICDLPSLTIRCLIQLAPCVPAWAVSAAGVIADESPADVRPAGGSPLTHLLLAALYDALTAKPSPITAGVAEKLCHVDSNETLQPLLVTLRQTFKEMAPPVDFCGITSPSAFEESTVAGQLATERACANAQGRRALAILLRFLKAKGPRLLPASGATAEAASSAANSCGPAKLLQAMFYIGNKHFDQLLAGSWQPDWTELLQEPLGLSQSEFWKQLQMRPEFRPGASLDRHDAAVVEAVERLFDDCRQDIAGDIILSESDDSDIEGDFGPVTQVELPGDPLKSKK